MTFTQLLSTWALRGMVLWAAVEGGLSLYDEGAREAAMLSELKSQRAVMERLALRERNAARALAAENARLQARTPSTGIADTTAIARAVRDDLNTLGAQEATIEPSAAPLAAGLARVTLDARWLEPSEASPAILYALAARRPGLMVADLAIEREAGSPQVEGRAKLQVVAREARQ